MKLEKYTCVLKEFNPHVGDLCYDNEGTIFYFDKFNWVKVGDIVELERDAKGFYRKVYVNQVLMTEDLFTLIHGKK
jgi:hypothetical protein